MTQLRSLTVKKKMGHVIADGNYSVGGNRETDYLRRRGQNCWVISLSLPENGLSISHTSARVALCTWQGASIVHP